MKTFAAFLRGINVGRSHKVSMAELKASFESLGFDNVKTFINSGNVIFCTETPAAQLVKMIEEKLVIEFGFDIPVIIRSEVELKQLLAKIPNSYDTSKVHIAFSSALITDLQTTLHEAGFDETDFTIDGKNLYLQLPNGVLESAIIQFLSKKKLTATSTMRTLNTVNKVYALIGKN